MTDLQPLIDNLDQTAELDAISEFEIVVVAMFVYFAHYHPDILLVEAAWVVYWMPRYAKSIGGGVPLYWSRPSILFRRDSAAIARHKVAVLRERVPSSMRPTSCRSGGGI